MGNAWVKKTVLIDQSVDDNLSEAIDLGEYSQLVGVVFPAALTSTAFSIQAAPTIDGTYIEPTDILDAAILAAANIESGDYIVFTQDQLSYLKGMRYIKVSVDDNEVADRIIILICREG